MLRHEHFEELCAAASVGQATPEELFELEEHASQCEGCRRAYADYLGVAAQQFAVADQNPSLSPREAQECLNSELFTRRFFERAQREGIVFSPAVGTEAARAKPVSLSFRRRPAWRIPATAAAAILLAVFMGVGLNLARGGSLKRAWTALHLRQEKAPAPVTTSSVLDQRVADLVAANLRLQAQIDTLNAALRKTSGQLNATETGLKSVSQDRQKLESDRDALEAQLKNVQLELAESQTLAANAQQEAAKLRDHAGDIEATLVADEVKIRDLTEDLKQKSAALDQEHQLLALGRDVTDLMGARNLHIVDVVDTDPRGKTRPAFGRIFFTEGKSLVFYAYDLNEAKIQKASYQYRVWAKKEGGDRQVKSLGIFYSDDKAQRRWVFKCDDPKILSEIDSVFVTLERDSDPSHPKGPNLMYAYLRGQPNHP